MAPVQAHAVVKRVLPLLGAFVSRICNPSVRLEEDGWTEVFFAVPPVGGAGCAAAGAEDAFVEAVEFGAVGFGLAVFSALK